jgi:hypothetical protein
MSQIKYENENCDNSKCLVSLHNQNAHLCTLIHAYYKDDGTFEYEETDILSRVCDACYKKAQTNHKESDLPVNVGGRKHHEDYWVQEPSNKSIVMTKDEIRQCDECVIIQDEKDRCEEEEEQRHCDTCGDDIDKYDLEFNIIFEGVYEEGSKTTVHCDDCFKVAKTKQEDQTCIICDIKCGGGNMDLDMDLEDIICDDCASRYTYDEDKEEYIEDDIPICSLCKCDIGDYYCTDSNVFCMERGDEEQTLCSECYDDVINEYIIEGEWTEAGDDPERDIETLEEHHEQMKYMIENHYEDNKDLIERYLLKNNSIPTN